MTNRHTTPRHGDYLDGDVDPKGRLEIERHLSECPACRADMIQLAGLKNLLSGITVPDPGDEYARSSEKAILDRLVEEEPVPIASGLADDSVRNLLKNLIRIAAVVTLLFGTFYLVDLREDSGVSRLAGTATHEGPAHEDSTLILDPVQKTPEAAKENLLPDSTKTEHLDTNVGK